MNTDGEEDMGDEELVSEEEDETDVDDENLNGTLDV